MTEVTRILAQIERGEPAAVKELLPLVYAELRILAAAKLVQEKPGQTLQPTALVHEAYLRLIGPADDQHWQSRGHFFAAAATAMRRILIDRTRRKQRKVHGGGRQRLDLDPNLVDTPTQGHDLLDLDAALTKFAQAEPVKSKLVELRYFAGLTRDQAAEVLGISPKTADRYWVYARAWLRRAIEGGENERKKSENR